MGKYLICLGFILILIGFLLNAKTSVIEKEEVSQKIEEKKSLEFKLPSFLSWFGKLPGDIHYKSENTTIFAPIASMLLISFILSSLFKIFK